jgi:hypothetical protein
MKIQNSESFSRISESDIPCYYQNSILDYRFLFYIYTVYMSMISLYIQSHLQILLRAFIPHPSQAQESHNGPNECILFSRHACISSAFPVGLDVIMTTGNVIRWAEFVNKEQNKPSASNAA